MPSIFDIDSLVAPLTGPDPVGKRLPSFTHVKDDLHREKLKSFREENDADAEKAQIQAAAVQIMNPQERAKYIKEREEQVKPSKRAEWAELLKSGTIYLQTHGKDLQVAVAMVEAATARHGYAGLNEGISLLRRLTNDCWDLLHPQIDDPMNPDDVEIRVNWISWLDQSDSAPFFPETIRKISVLKGKAGKPVSVASRRPPAQGEPEDFFERLSELEYEEAVQIATPDDLKRLQDTNEIITATLAELDTLIADIDAHIDANVRKSYSAPSMTNLRNALEDGQSLVRGILAKRIVASESTEDGDKSSRESGGLSGPGGSGGGAVNVAGGAIRSREDIYKRLVELANALESIDPHSPVPDVIRRATELRDLRFPELVDKLSASQSIVEFMRNPIVKAEESN